MKAIKKTVLHVSAAILALSLLSGLPASAQDIAAGNGKTALAATAAGPAPKLGAVSDTMALAIKRKKQSMRIVRASAPRLASLWNHGWGCSGTWCGRQFTLMLGIGY